ncbi:hypothetical protein [Streptomyces sp. NPDC054849]
MSITVPAPVKAIEPALRLLPGARPTLDHVFDSPLEGLLAEFNVTVLQSEITDAGFFGAVVVRADRITVLLSPNLGDYERDFFPRYLLAQALGLDMTPLPTPFEVEINPLIDGIPA